MILASQGQLGKEDIVYLSLYFHFAAVIYSDKSSDYLTA